MKIMSTIEHEPTGSVPNPPTDHEEKKIYKLPQSTYKLEKQFLPKQDETLEKAFMRKIQEISYESSRFRDVLTVMGYKIGRNDIAKFFKMRKKSFKDAPSERVSKVQAALGKFHFRNP